MSKKECSLIQSKVLNEKHNVSKSNSKYNEKSTNFQKSLFTEKPRDTSFHQPVNVIETIPLNKKVEYV